MTGPAMIAIQRTPTWAKVLLALLLGAVAMWLFSCYNGLQAKKQADLKAKSDSIAILRPALDSALRLANAHTDTVVRERTIFTDRILAGDRPSIPRAEVVELANKCTEVEKSCAAQQAAAKAMIANLESQVAVEKKRVALMPPRFKVSLEGGYGFIDKAMPFGGRGELQLAGPISLVGSAGVRIPTDTGAVTRQADLKVSYTFGRR